MQVGTTKDQGFYNKPSAAVHPGALAAGTLPQYNTIPLQLPVKGTSGFPVTVTTQQICTMFSMVRSFCHTPLFQPVTHALQIL